MKKALYFGLAAGGLLGVAVALSMDLMLGKSLGGGWSEAVAHDLNHMFGANLAQNHFAVIIGVIIVLGIIGVIGALIGGFFFAMVARLLIMLAKGK
jgi:hypothetical protein